MFKKTCNIFQVKDNVQNLEYLQHITVRCNAFSTQDTRHTCNMKENSTIFLIKWFCLDLSNCIDYGALSHLSKCLDYGAFS